MTDHLLFLLRAFMALGILLAAVRILLRRNKLPRRPFPQRAEPSGHGLPDLARLLAASAASTYSRDRVQERMSTLAADLHTLEQEDRPPRATKEPLDLQEDLLAAYLAEDHVGFRGGRGRRSSQDPGFLHRTEAVLAQLEGHRQNSKGDQP
jgi:hypothetical protein